jgi:hypothetical protein
MEGSDRGLGVTRELAKQVLSQLSYTPFKNALQIPYILLILRPVTPLFN